MKSCGESFRTRMQKQADDLAHGIEVAKLKDRIKKLEEERYNLIYQNTKDAHRIKELEAEVTRQKESAEWWESNATQWREDCQRAWKQRDMSAAAYEAERQNCQQLQARLDAVNDELRLRMGTLLFVPKFSASELSAQDCRNIQAALKAALEKQE